MDLFFYFSIIDAFSNYSYFKYILYVNIIRKTNIIFLILKRILIIIHYLNVHLKLFILLNQKYSNLICFISII